jgi:hypothetical protein
VWDELDDYVAAQTVLQQCLQLLHADEYSVCALATFHDLCGHVPMFHPIATLRQIMMSRDCGIAADAVVLSVAECAQCVLPIVAPKDRCSKGLQRR